MSMSRGASITRAASKQTYLTIRFLVDRDRVEDAFRAYAYFRWVDDVLDADTRDRAGFLARQNELLAACMRREAPRDVCSEEALLVDLVRRAGPGDRLLDSYLRNLMRVMAFDVARRGRLISQSELDDYTRWLAIGVTDAMHHFIGQGAQVPDDRSRYMAATGAHIVHMLRDTHEDLAAGYYNVPRELLEAHGIGPDDVDTGAYRAWVTRRVRLARASFDAGASYFARVECARLRLAGLAYSARFAWLLDTIEREQYRLRPRYDERRTLAIGLRMGWQTLARAVRLAVPAVEAARSARGGHA
jgi:phytoene/squalene synthetase